MTRAGLLGLAAATFAIGVAAAQMRPQYVPQRLRQAVKKPADLIGGNGSAVRKRRRSKLTGTRRSKARS